MNNGGGFYHISYFSLIFLMIQPPIGVLYIGVHAFSLSFSCSVEFPVIINDWGGFFFKPFWDFFFFL